MALFSRIVQEGMQYSDEYREKPFDLKEKMFLDAMKGGARPGKEDGVEIEPLHNFKAKRPEFIDLQNRGYVKHQAVLRTGKEEPQQSGKKKGKGPKTQGRSISLHYWEHPETGDRKHFKFTSSSPYVTRTEGMSLFDRVLAESAGRPDIRSRNLAKFMRNVTNQAVRTYEKTDPRVVALGGDPGALSQSFRRGAQQDIANLLKPTRKPEKSDSEKYYWDRKRQAELDRLYAAYGRKPPPK